MENKIICPNCSSEISVEKALSSRYKDHYEHVTEQLCRKPYPFPQIRIKDRQNIEDFEWTDIEIIDYLSHPKISADMVA